MTGPDQIGERFAEDWWSRLGGLLITRKQSYTHATEALSRVCGDPVARQAFDRRLGQIVVNTPGTLAQPPKRRRRP
jgi:hypothetical protein